MGKEKKDSRRHPIECKQTHISHGTSVRERVWSYESPKTRKMSLSSKEGDFSGFEDEKIDGKRLAKVEREMEVMKGLINGLLKKQEEYYKENMDLRRRCGECECCGRIEKGK